MKQEKASLKGTSPVSAGLVIGMFIRLISGFVLMGVLLFSCAGTVNYVGGWLFIVSLGVPMAVFGIVLLIREPDTLKRRMAGREPDKRQALYVTEMGLLFIVLFGMAGFDHRWGWSKMPIYVSVAALVIALLGYGIYVAVILQNSYAARIVAVYKEQKIITDGLYGMVRHPMYLAYLLILLAMPLILGSWISLVPVLLIPFLLARRIKNEEALLVRELKGYDEYVKTVRYRMVPYIW
ncbi:MAG: isoprenylcysteine carboxylmethyltransferase family protein [Lachnospiraceae bacterium]|nr:isoprenylcysteine carboxylmethyltransferase family protein [Lachnospiraceae bacterium]